MVDKGKIPKELKRKRKNKGKELQTLSKAIKKTKKKKTREVVRFAQAETVQELQERLRKVLTLRSKPVKLAKNLSELLSIRSGYLVHVSYIPGAEKEIIRGTLPWVRHIQTDATDHNYVSIICFSDSALKTNKVLKKLALGLINSEQINKNGVRLK